MLQLEQNYTETQIFASKTQNFISFSTSDMC